MKIEESRFEGFPTNGAVNININPLDIDLVGSVFQQCNNILSGGAIRVVAAKCDGKFARCCASECYTAVSDNSNDFGQFIYVTSSNGQIYYQELAVSQCPSYKHADLHNGALSISGSANLICSNSNSSNNFCRFGPGFASEYSNNVKLNYMNFANDTSYIIDYPSYWIATIFHSSSQGNVKYSNFFECSSYMKKLSTPTGTFNGCIFTNCINYDITLLSKDNKEGTPSNFYYPKTCFIIKNQCCSIPSSRKHVLSLSILLING